MSKRIPPMIQYDISEDIPPVTSDSLETQLDDSMQFDADDFESYEDEIASMPEVVEKPKPKSEDIFDLPNLAVRPEYLDDLVSKSDTIPEGVPSPPPKSPKRPNKTPVSKPKKARKPMSEEHKKKLAIAREKAMAVRKAKAEEKKKMKALEKEEKELLKAQKVKRVQKLKKQVQEDDPVPDGVIDQGITEDIKRNNNTNHGRYITKEQLEQSQFDAITKYDTLRKQRKAEKKKKEELEKQQKELIDKLKPQGYRYRDGSNRWDSCY
jgi:hypothetical protein